MGLTKPMIKGLFYAPHTVANAMKTAHFAALLFEKLGFEAVGRYENVGWKLGAWRSVYDYLLRLKPEGGTPDMN